MKNFENFIKDNIDGLEGLPPNVSWSKASGWNKLSAKQSKSAGLGVLGVLTANKQATPWYYAVAASLTVAIASYFVVQDFPTEIKTSSQAVSVIEYLIPNTPEQAHVSAVEKTLSYPENILNLMKKPNESDLAHYVTSSILPNSPAQQEAKVFVNKAYLITQNQFDVDHHENIFIPKAILKPVPRQRILFDVQGNMGLISDNFNAGLEADLLWQVKNNYAFGVGAKSNYIFTSNSLKENISSNKGSDSGIATFITASYHKNISKKENKPLWVAVKGGYLVQNNSGVFSDNTVSLEVTVNLNEKIAITPQVYLTNNLKKAMPGIKVGMTLGKFQKDVSI